jgi:50S ribosomal protein L16 3-hydroxylase
MTSTPHEILQRERKPAGTYNFEMGDPLLGGLAPSTFLRRYWQKRPLLVRRALPDFRGALNVRSLAALAARADVESRLVEGRRGRWQVSEGPIPRARLRRLPGRDWTLLVSGVNLHVAAAERLLRRFSFLPFARLDDVMVSYAAPGGGVGPHVDSYDVFLLQGPGRRVWRLARPRRFTEVRGAQLRLIEGFAADEEILVEPGDLLYLPPGWGHDGVALDACFTYSIGLRAPRGAELGAAFLDWLHERGLPDRAYRDPELRPVARPGRIPAPLLEHTRRALARVRWSRRDAEEFLGEYLSAPKPHVVFAAPRRPLARAVFGRRLARLDVALDARTQLLYRGARFFVNGEALVPPARARVALELLADARRAPGRRLAGAGLADLTYEWYRLGYLHLEDAS